jgi:hypothetical protein
LFHLWENWKVFLWYYFLFAHERVLFIPTNFYVTISSVISWKLDSFLFAKFKKKQQWWWLDVWDEILGLFKNSGTQFFNQQNFLPQKIVEGLFEEFCLILFSQITAPIFLRYKKMGVDFMMSHTLTNKDLCNVSGWRFFLPKRSGFHSFLNHDLIGRRWSVNWIVRFRRKVACRFVICKILMNLLWQF